MAFYNAHCNDKCVIHMLWQSKSQQQIPSNRPKAIDEIPLRNKTKKTEESKCRMCWLCSQIVSCKRQRNLNWIIVKMYRHTKKLKTIESMSEHSRIRWLARANKSTFMWLMSAENFKDNTKKNYYYAIDFARIARRWHTQTGLFRNEGILSTVVKQKQSSQI